MTRRDFASTAKAAGIGTLRNLRVVVPLLLDDAAEAVEAGVLVAGVAGAAGGDVGQVDVGRGTGALDDGPQPEIGVTFQSSQVVRERRETADRGVHANGLIQNTPVSFSDVPVFLLPSL